LQLNDLKKGIRLNKEVVSLAEEIRRKLKKGKKIAFVSGNFNVVHPGHIRLLNFAAECADYLVVGVNSDGHPDVFVPQELRLEGIKAISLVNFALILAVPVSEFIACLKPEIVVKGKEHELLLNVEQAVVESYGGKLIFASGEIWFSHLNHLKNELQKVILPSIDKPTAYLQRHSTDIKKLSHIVNRFSELRVAVLGDLIIDEYIFCDPLGMSQEDPTIVVTPIKRDLFVGGAGIVAAHAKSLGACVNYFSVVGNDVTADYARDKLKEYGVNSCLIVDESRPTTLKRRFRAQGKTLLRVSELRQHNISHELQAQMMAEILKVLESSNLMVFSDFSYGCLSQPLVDEIVEFCTQRGIPMVADSQSSSQIGDITRFKNMLLITPTEREARLAIRDTHSGLMTVADALRRKTNAQHVFITLGSEGLLVYSPKNGMNEVHTDELPVFNLDPKDLAGAGDCLLICSAMSLVAGASIWESAYLGSIAAACQVSRVGNLPLGQAELKKELVV
jgi:rfaE bifunctional protein kinase chain/domain